MPETLFAITRKDLFDLFARLSDTYRVIVPYLHGEKLNFDDFSSAREDSIELGGIRQSQPLKSFINYPREKIIGGETRRAKPLLIAGVKGCDLAGLSVQDHVFLGGDEKDPFYETNRAATVIIGADCTFVRETCFCLAMDGAPYPRANFDLSLSAIDGQFLVTVGSEKGEAIVQAYPMFFKRHADVEARGRMRQKVSDEIRQNITRRGMPDTKALDGAMKRQYLNDALWNDQSSTCVECGACNLVCPTCHCFLLFDEKAKDGPRRYRVWDACLYKSFARVAGGANPRKHIAERIRNRFDKKFSYFPDVLKQYACTGCGRCIEACPGDIDLREVLKGIASGAWNKPPHE